MNVHTFDDDFEHDENITDPQHGRHGRGGHGGHGGRGPRRGGRHGGFGPGEGRGMPGFPPGPGFGGPGFPGFPGFPGDDEGRGRGRGGRRGPGRGRRGDVRSAIIALLGEKPMNGYQLIHAIAEKSEGLWSPGAGSVYPALGLLEDEGLIAPTEENGKKLYALTDEGRSYASDHADETTAPWERVAEPHKGFLDVRPQLGQLGMAVQQVVMTGDEEQVEAARAILENARKDVYRLLAGDAPASSRGTDQQS